MKINCTQFVRHYDILKNWSWYNKLDTKKSAKGETSL